MSEGIGVGCFILAGLALGALLVVGGTVGLIVCGVILALVFAAWLAFLVWGLVTVVREDMARGIRNLLDFRRGEGRWWLFKYFLG